MNELIIKLTGEIQSSNFDEWKTDLIKQIQSTRTELTTDDEFAAAVDHVKQFKKAEKALKAAKQSALEQAADIQALFAAIDEVAAEARAARLTLERQIKTRKQELKEAAISAGTDTIKAMLAAQSADFQLVDSGEFLDVALLKAAVKGRGSLKTMKKAIKKVTDSVAVEIENRASEVANNATLLDTIETTRAAMFQDRIALLAMPTDRLKSTIDERIAAVEATADESAAGAEATPDEAPEETSDNAPDEPADELNLDFDMQGIADSDETLPEEEFELNVTLKTTRPVAEAITAKLRKQLGDNAAVVSIKLLSSG
ncbi:MAG: hypothetical protein V3U76_14195 [Granulosicoccus sp.]